MMHHNTKFGNKMLGGSEDIICQTLTFWPFAVTSTLNAVIQFFFFITGHSGFWWCIIRPSLFAKNIVETVIFWSYEPSLWPWPWIYPPKKQKKTKIRMTLWLMMLRHNTKLGIKCSVIQKISSGQTFTDILNLRCDFDLERSNSIFPQDTQAYDAILWNKVWLQTDQQFRRYNRNSHILII